MYQRGIANTSDMQMYKVKIKKAKDLGSAFYAFFASEWASHAYDG